MYAALGVVALVLAIAFGSWLVRDDETSGSASNGDGQVLQLAMPAQEAGRCAPVQAKSLAKAESAFDGEAVEVTDETVTIAVSEWYAGEAEATQVRLDLRQAPASLAGQFAFEKGRRYLVAANDQAVLVCGFSGPYSAELEQVYQDAFPGS